VYSNLRQFRLLAGVLPSGVIHEANWLAGLAFAGNEHVLRMQATLNFDHTLGNIVEHYHPILAVLDFRPIGAAAEVGGDDEYRDLKFRYRALPSSNASDTLPARDNQC
jgi:hypothetical protein